MCNVYTHLSTYIPVVAIPLILFIKTEYVVFGEQITGYNGYPHARDTSLIILHTSPG